MLTRDLTRARISATVDPFLLEAVDAYVESHPEIDRSTVIDQALLLWYARIQEEAIAEQHRDSADLPPSELAAWRAIRRAAAERRLSRVR